MKYEFRNFNCSYYERVYDFLRDLSKDSRMHINWNPARWEWMFFHPEFDRSLLEKIGLWFSGDELVGVAVYDHYLGEAFFAAKMEFEELEKSILDYVVENFCDENGIGVAVNDMDSQTVKLLTDYGFSVNEQTENVLELSLDEFDFSVEEIAGISIKNLNLEKDLYKHHELLWKGFDHEGPAPLDKETMDKQKEMLSAPHMNPLLHIVAENEETMYASYCGLWYDEETDYVYVEPVCTLPEYRNRGIAKMVLTEALKRAYDLGAKKAYVISESDFYKGVGFKQHSHYTFYWYKNSML